jgi:hypothetical protein
MEKMFVYQLKANLKGSRSKEELFDIFNKKYKYSLEQTMKIIRMGIREDIIFECDNVIYLTEKGIYGD